MFNFLYKWWTRKKLKTYKKSHLINVTMADGEIVPIVKPDNLEIVINKDGIAEIKIKEE